MSPPRLRLFGVVHVDRVSKVTAELDAFADGVDALFIEQPEEVVTARTLARCLLRVPAFFFGWALFVLSFVPLYAVLHREMAEAEKVATRRVAGRHGIPIHAIDDHPLVVMSRSGPRWWVANWAALAVVALDPVGSVVTAVALVFGATSLVALHRWRRKVWLALAVPLSWGLLAAVWWTDAISPAFLLVAATAYLATMVTTLGHRNDHMLERVGAIAEREGYDESCLVTGRAHLSGLVDAAPDTGVAVTRVKPPKWLRRSDREWAVARQDDGDETPSAATTASRDHAGTADATVGQRLLAAVLDVVALGLLTAVSAFLLGFVGAVALGDAGLEAGIYLGLFGVPIGYFPLAEWRYGRTVGKRLLNLTVCLEDGAPCTLGAALIRHLLRPVEILALGLGFVSMVVSSRTQRLGDRPVGTVVVRPTDDAEPATAKDLSADRPSSRP